MAVGEASSFHFLQRSKCSRNASETSANQALFSARALVSKGLFILPACDKDKDVRDPAAKMTSILPACHSVPTVSAHKTVSDIDIYI